MKKAKTAETLSEAFLRVRDYLNAGNSEDQREDMICFATKNACKAGAIKTEHSTMIRDIVMERLSPSNGIRHYLTRQHGISQYTTKQVQDYRHAWLIHLSEEFKDA